MIPYYDHNGITIYHGDCLEIMPLLSMIKINAVIMDPPFAFTGGISNGRSSQASNQFFIHWWRDVCEKLTKIIQPTGEGFCWCDWRTAWIIAEGFVPAFQTYDFWRVPQMLYHYREMPGQGQPFRNSVDLIAYLRGPKSKAQRIPNTTHNWISKYWYYGKHKYHQAEKSPDICSQLLEWCSDEGQTVIDPFMGSGPVAVACKALNRNFIGIDNTESCCETAIRRLSQEAFPFKERA